ncbi:hypothetical protein CC86DRAFT_437868 [Ophiobolus disseminans]|uniref:Uncharacterized protein n=1 Tax=Ophiobolus disseminans TaxID=1469910 RepID=A0A6A7A7E4_9PLEO|nr:hypothetical protein CC86DRAFT_437868 [Ophiobolus disseminans]
MGNVVTRLTHHKSRHTHREIVVPVPGSSNLSIEDADAPKIDPYQHPSPPAKPALHPVPEAIIAAAERGMIAENFMCSDLPSPVFRHAHAETRYGYFPDAHEDRQQSLESEESQAHESDAVERHGGMVLTRGEEACGGAGKRGGWRGRSVRWKGVGV